MRLVAVLAFAGVLLAPIPAAAQAATDCRVNLETVDTYNDPLIPVSVQIGTFEKRYPPYDLHVTAPCGDDWLEGVVVKFRNMTSKTVTGVWIAVDFSDLERPDVPRMGYTFRLGETPERSTYKRDKTRARILQHPPLQNPSRSEVIVALKPEYSNIKRVVEPNQPVSTIHSVWVKVVQVYFADGTVFNGWYQKPDPNDQTAYIKADPRDFGRGAPVH